MGAGLTGKIAFAGPSSVGKTQAMIALYMTLLEEDVVRELNINVEYHARSDLMRRYFPLWYQYLRFFGKGPDRTSPTEKDLMLELIVKFKRKLLPPLTININLVDMSGEISNALLSVVSEAPRILATDDLLKKVHERLTASGSTIDIDTLKYYSDLLFNIQGLILVVDAYSLAKAATDQKFAETSSEVLSYYFNVIPSWIDYIKSIHDIKIKFLIVLLTKLDKITYMGREDKDSKHTPVSVELSLKETYSDQELRNILNELNPPLATSLRTIEEEYGIKSYLFGSWFKECGVDKDTGKPIFCMKNGRVVYARKSYIDMIRFIRDHIH